MLAAKLRRRGQTVPAGLLLAVLLVYGPSLSSAQPSPTAVEGEGELEVIHVDGYKFSRYLYYLNAPNRRIPLHFAKNPPTKFLTGAKVRVRGTQNSDGSLALASGGSVTNTSPATSPTAPLPNTLGPQSTLVILVNFQDDAVQPFTIADAESMFFGTANRFFQENSYGQTSITGSVYGWYTIPDSVTTCNISQFAIDAQNAAVAAGVNLSNYTRYVYAFPYDSVCGWAGASNVGGNPSQSWINANTLDIHTIDHELGHALGLWHSHLYDCGTMATIGSSCTIDEYGDILDTMGTPQPASPHYNAFQKQQLGWLNYSVSPSILTVQSSGTYVLNAYELPGAGPNALKILKSTNPTTGAKTWYYLESRQAIGFDAFLTDTSACEPCWNQTVTDGVLFHIGTDGGGNSSDLLDMTPATPSYGWYFDPSLAVGQIFQDPAAGVTFTTLWVTSTQAAVNVQFVGSITLATNQQSYSLGQTASATATATYGGSPVPNVSVSFTITKANGNVVTGSANTGKNGTATYNLKLKQTDPVGTYAAAAAATIKGNAHNATTNFMVQ